MVCPIPVHFDDRHSQGVLSVGQQLVHPVVLPSGLFLCFVIAFLISLVATVDLYVTEGPREGSTAQSTY